jgi:glycine betaine catabolism B
MKKEFIQQFDGYAEIAKEQEIATKLGNDHQAERGNAQRLLNRLHPSRLDLQVADIIDETSSTKTLRLISPDRYLPPFQAGQYIAVFVETQHIRTSRAYSISSSPNQLAYYDITIRRVDDGLVSGYLLDEVQAGDRIETSGPEGHFHFNPVFHDKEMVCIAGGSGITPIMSMIREIVEGRLDRQLTLFYGNRNTNDIIFDSELHYLADRSENLKYIPVIEKPANGYTGVTGYITGEVIQNTVGRLENKSFYLCGPQALYDFCTQELEKLDVPARKIRKEVYGAPLDICDQPGWPREVKPETDFSVRVQKGPEFVCKAGESLMTALEKQSINLPALCRSGECSMCRLKVISGKVFQPLDVKLRKSDRLSGYVHGCVSYPLSDLEILI